MYHSTIVTHVNLSRADSIEPSIIVQIPYCGVSEETLVLFSIALNEKSKKTQCGLLQPL